MADDRTRASRRKRDFAEAKRKRDICVKNYGFEYYDNLHQYSKNKIHCSCPMCRGKLWEYGDNSIKQNKISIQRKLANITEGEKEELYD